MTDMRTPLGKVRGLGSAHDGTGHFWLIRVTGVALLFLALFAVGLVFSVVGRDFADARAVIGQPLIAVLLGLFVVVALIHMRIGMQEIIADYVHGELMKVALLMLNTFFVVVLGAACVFSLLKISFGG